MPRRKLIYKENLDLDSDESTRLSYNVVFREPEMKQEIVEQEEQEVKKELKNALEQQRHEFENKLSVEKEQAAQQAYQKGLTAGKKEAQQTITASLDTFKEALNQVESKVETLTEQLNPGITTMVFDLAEKILQIPIESPQLRNTIQKEVRQVFETLDNELAVKIAVSPQDVSTIEELTNHLNMEKITINEDKNLNPGEYTIETSEKTIERKFKKILNDIRRNTDLEEWELKQ